MNAPDLDIAFWNYDRTRLLADGAVKIDGVEATFHSARIVPEIFEAGTPASVRCFRTGNDLFPAYVR
jgi:hypothetical protein